MDAQISADASPPGDAALPLGWVDFAVTGCVSGEGSEASPCIGPSPLRLRFTTLAPAEIDNQLWDFGDGSPAEPAANPEHEFVAPGSYDIALNVDGPGGTAGVTRLAAVVVIPAPLGATCSDDSHCASGDCACEDAASCPALLSAGLCVLDCPSHDACGGNRCIDLDPTGLASEDWHRTTCLPACTPGGGECREGHSCQALLGVDGVMSFACFSPGLVLPLGSSCKDADGNLVDAACASGLCLDQGDRGMCSATCDTQACPAGSACATFVGGAPAPHCLANCESFACDADAQLGCQAPGTAFTVDETANAAGYCAAIP